MVKKITMLSADFLTRIFTKDQSWLLLERISTGHDINIFLHSIRAFCISFLYVHFRVRNALLLQRLQFAFRPFSLLLTVLRPFVPTHCSTCVAQGVKTTLI